MTCLEIINTICNLVVAISVTLAFRTYFYNKEKDNMLFVLEQISLFREKILAEGEKFINFAKGKDKEYVFSRIRLDNPSNKEIKYKYCKEFEAQSDLIKKYEALSPMQINCLNLIEELSLRILYSKTFNHKAFKSIKPSFIYLIEIMGFVLVQQREIITGNQIYSGTLELYEKWKDDVDRLSSEERIQNLTK